MIRGVFMSIFSSRLFFADFCQSRRKDPPYPPFGGGAHACSGASCCVGEPYWAHQNAKNLLVAGAPPRTPLGELTTLPQTP